MTPDKLDNFLCFLAESGEWHSLSELAQAIKLPEETVEMVASLLDDFNFISLDHDKRRVRIQPSVRQLHLEEPQEAP